MNHVGVKQPNRGPTRPSRHETRQNIDLTMLLPSCVKFRQIAMRCAQRLLAFGPNSARVELTCAMNVIVMLLRSAGFMTPKRTRPPPPKEPTVRLRLVMLHSEVVMRRSPNVPNYERSSMRLVGYRPESLSWHRPRIVPPESLFRCRVGSAVTKLHGHVT